MGINTGLCSCKVAEKMRTALIFFSAFTIALAGKKYLIETGENVGVDKSAGTNDYSAMPRPTTDSVCKNKKDGDRCDMCWGSKPTTKKPTTKKCNVHSAICIHGILGMVNLPGTCKVGKCKRGICGD